MFVLSNVKHFYDGSSSESPSLKDAIDIVVDGPTIKEIKPHGESLSVGTAATTIDCSEYTVTPGLIDCHSHITAIGLQGAHLDLMEEQVGILYVEKILYRTLVNGGVTTLRDVGGATHFMKRMVDEGMIVGPRMKVAICMLSTSGGHADFRGPDRCHDTISRLWPERVGRPSSIVDGPWECRKRVREIVACGSDLIKLCTSPGVASPSDKLENEDFSNEEIFAICDEAKKRGMRVAAHAHSKKGIAMAIENGVDDIQHISFLDESLMERAHKKGLTVTPTSWIMNHLPSQGVPEHVMDKVKKVAEAHAKAVEIAAKGGMKILMGTDPVFSEMHGKNYMELVHLMNEGVSALQAWYGATGLAASEIGAEKTGVLSEGNLCDLLICRGDVINDPSLLGEGGLIEVLKEGQAYRGAIKELPQRRFESNIDEKLGNV